MNDTFIINGDCGRLVPVRSRPCWHTPSFALPPPGLPHPEDFDIVSIARTNPIICNRERAYELFTLRRLHGEGALLGFRRDDWAYARQWASVHELWERPGSRHRAPSIGQNTTEAGVAKQCNLQCEQRIPDGHGNRYQAGRLIPA